MLPPPFPFEPPFAIRVALAALEAWANLTKPPAPPSWPGEHVKVPLPALEVPIKKATPGDPSVVSAPAVVKVPLPAPEVSAKPTEPAHGSQFTVPLFVKKVPLAALEASEKEIRPLL